MKNHIKTAIAVTLYVCAFALFMPQDAEARHGRRGHHGMRMMRRGGMHHSGLQMRMERNEHRKKLFERLDKVESDQKEIIKKLNELQKADEEDIEEAEEQLEDGSVEELTEKESDDNKDLL